MKHGLTGYVHHKCRCEICKAANAASWQRRYTKNREKMRAANKIAVAKWYAAHHEEAKADGRRRTKRYADANREKVRERYRAWLAANPDKAKAASTAYIKANPHKGREAAKTRRARLAGAEILQVSDRDWHRLCVQHDGRCAYCGAAVETHKDHVIPITRGGRHSIGNLLPACKPCNSSKGNKLLTEWGGRLNDLPTGLSVPSD